MGEDGGVGEGERCGERERRGTKRERSERPSTVACWSPGQRALFCSS